MPVAALKGIAKKNKTSVRAVEKDWKEAKGVVKGQKGTAEGNWGLVNFITQKKAHAHVLEKSDELLKSIAKAESKKKKTKDADEPLTEIPEIDFEEVLDDSEAYKKAKEETSNPSLYPNTLLLNADRAYRYGVYSGKIDPDNFDPDYSGQTVDKMLNRKSIKEIAIEDDQEVKHEIRDSYIPATVIQRIKERDAATLDLPKKVDTDSPEDDESEDKTGNRGLQKRAALPGGDSGLAAKAKFKAKDANPQELKEGIKFEKEHSSDPAVEEEIALDHISEDPKYYDKLKTMEKHLKTWDSMTKSWVEVF